LQAELQVGLQAEAQEKIKSLTKSAEKIAEQLRVETERRIRVEEKVQAQSQAWADAEERARAEAQARAEAEKQARREAEDRAKAYGQALAKAEEKAKAQAQARLDAEVEAYQQAQSYAEALKQANAKAELQSRFRAEAEGKVKERALARIRERAEGIRENARQIASIEENSERAVAEIKTPSQQDPAVVPKTPQKEKPHPPKPADQLNSQTNDSGKILADPSARIQNTAADLTGPVLTMRATDIMQGKVVWADPDSSVRNALTKMQHDTPCVIVGRSGILAGILTPADLAGAVSPYLRPEFARWRRPQDDATLQIKIKWIMTRPVHTVTPDTPLSDVVDKMQSLNCCVLPVTSEKGKLRGLITAFDILRAALSSTPEPTADLAVSKKHSHTPAINIHTYPTRKPAKVTACS